MGYSFQLAARDLLYAPFQRQDSTYLSHVMPVVDRVGKGDVCLMTHTNTHIKETNYRKEGRKEMFYLTTHSTHFIYGYMASDIR